VPLCFSSSSGVADFQWHLPARLGRDREPGATQRPQESVRQGGRGRPPQEPLHLRMAICPSTLRLTPLILKGDEGIQLCLLR
jgi:hypothetical protein